MAGDPAEQDAEVDRPRVDPCLPNLNGDEADIVGVGQHADRSPVIEGDVELAWQPVHVARVEDVMAQAFGQRCYVEEFRGVEAGDGRGGDIADIVGAGAREVRPRA